MATSGLVKLDLFNDPNFSDGILKIITRQNEVSKDRGKKKQKLDRAKEISFHISSCVLALQSEFFRGKVQTLVGNASTKTSKTFEVLVEAGEEAIAEELIKYMYSEEITLTSGEDVARLLTLAHQFLVQSCEAKCLQLLLEGKLTINIAASLCRSHEEAPFMKEVLDNVKTPLLEEFGDLEVVWSTQALQDKFLRLPLALVELLFASPELRVASENTVFTAGYLWMEHSDFDMGDKSGNDAWARLLEPMRFGCLSIFFLVDVVSHVKCDDMTIKSKVVDKAITTRFFSESSALEENEAEKADRIQRPRSSLTSCSVEWKVSASDIDGLLEEDSEGLESGAQSWCGYKLALCLFTDEDEELNAGVSFIETSVPIEKRHCAAVELSGELIVKSPQGRTLERDTFSDWKFQQGDRMGQSLAPKSSFTEGVLASEVLSQMGLLHDGFLHISGNIRMNMGPM